LQKNFTARFYEYKELSWSFYATAWLRT